MGAYDECNIRDKLMVCVVDHHKQRVREPGRVQPDQISAHIHREDRGRERARGSKAIVCIRGDQQKPGIHCKPNSCNFNHKINIRTMYTARMLPSGSMSCIYIYVCVDILSARVVRKRRRTNSNSSSSITSCLNTHLIGFCLANHEVSGAI